MSDQRPLLRKMLSLHEGRVGHAYQDSLGFWTIGVGHLVDRRLGGGLPKHIIDALLDWDIAKHAEELFKELPLVAYLDPVRRAVLIDMAFNLGVQKLLGFKNTLRMVSEGDYEGAAKGMLSSLWARQVKTRAERLAEMMRTGELPEEFK